VVKGVSTTATTGSHVKHHGVPEGTPERGDMVTLPSNSRATSFRRHLRDGASLVHVIRWFPA